MLQKEAQICHSALEHNMQFFREKLGASKLVACVKANAYGHGFYEVMPILSKADACYVHTWDAALRLRRDYPNLRIILAGFIGSEITISHLAREQIDWIVFSPAQLQLLEMANYEGEGFHVWLKLDTGMNRLGFSKQEAEAALHILEHSPFVKDIILMTHFACGPEPAAPSNQYQLDNFLEFTNKHPYHETSLGGSAMALHQKLPLGDWVRIGAGMYGLSPFPEKSGMDLGLRPVMRLRAKVISIKSCAAGAIVGYDATWTAKLPTRLAALALGYGDGYLRSIGSGAPVYINGAYAKVVGRISMDTIVVELPKTMQVTVGDWAELWGENLPVETIAAHAGTIGYELCTTVGRRVKRSIME